MTRMGASCALSYAHNASPQALAAAYTLNRESGWVKENGRRTPQKGMRNTPIVIKNISEDS
jgi:hypothetical protein